jgi:hypothetical protein
MSDSNQRLTAWRTKTDTDRVKETLEALLPDMLEHYKTWGSFRTAGCKGQNEADSRVGVPVRTLPFPLSPLRRGISGESFALVVMALLEKWTARGLDADVLAAIRT